MLKRKSLNDIMYCTNIAMYDGRPRMAWKTGLEAKALKIMKQYNSL
jgi:hypothetical protein